MSQEPDGKSETSTLAEPWQEVARQIAVETDSDRMLELCRKLEAIFLVEEREKVKRRFPNVWRGDTQR